MPRLDRLSEMARNKLLTHPVLVHDDAPWVKPDKPLSQMRLALVTTAGLHLRGDRPFNSGEQGYREIPSAAGAAGIILSHGSIGFDRAGFMRDLNLVFPIDRLREMAERGEIGGIGPAFFSFLGSISKYDKLIGGTGAEVGRRLKDEGVDAVLLTGA
jgi:D-proline reductase (dithiol) PrdB